MINKAASIFVIAVAGLAITRMLFDLHTLRPLLAGLETMKFNTGLSLFCSGIAILLLDQQQSTRTARSISVALSVIVLLICLLTLGEHFLKWDLGLDDLFYRHPATAIATPHPGRMPVATAIFLFSLNLALLLIPWRKTHFLIHVILITGIVFLVLMFLGVLLRLSVVKTTGVFSKALINSVILFLLLFVSAFFSRPLSHLKFSFQKKLVGVFAMVCLAIVILFFSFKAGIKRTNESAGWVEHTNEVLLLSAKIRTLISEVEAGVRDYFLTGNERYLPVYDKRIDSLDKAIIGLRLLTKDNAGQQKLIDTLQTHIASYVSFRKELVTQVKIKQTPFRQLNAMMGNRKEAMDEAKSIIGSIQQEEEELLAKRKTENQQQIELANRSIILFLVIVALLLVSAFMVVFYNTRARNKAELALRNSLDEIANFKTLFECAPGLYLILYPDLTISAASDEYLKATMKQRNDILGRGLFEVFPDNPDNPAADGVSNLRASLNFVLANKTPHTMADQRYDVVRPDGSFEERVWHPLNKPILDARGEVVYIIHSVEDITVRLRNEQELIRKTNEIKDLYNNAPCGYHSLDKEGCLVDINDTELKWLGYTREELIGHINFADIITPGSRERFHTQYAAFQKNGFVNDVEFNLIRRDGTTLPAILSATAIYDDNGTYLRSRTTVLDYTERKKLDDQLKQFNRELEKRVEEKTREVIEKEQQYRFLLENMREGIQVIGHDWKYIFVNHSAEGQSKYSADELVGRTMMEIYPGVEQTELFAVLQRCMQERTASIFENEFNFANGTKGWFELSIQPVPEGLFILSMDITERKKAEAFLVASEETRRLIMNSAQDAIICIDTAGKITVWTPQSEKIFGWNEPEVLGKELASLIIPPRHRKSHTQGMAHYLRTGEGPVLNKLIEITAINRMGIEFPVELSIVPYEQNGQLFFCGFIRDITERKKVEENLKRYAEELKASNTELERFAYIASHDLQEPLRMVSSFLSLLEEEMAGQLDETKKEYIHYAVDGAERMKTLIQALLQYSRVGTNKEDFTQTDMNEVAKYVNKVLDEEIRKTSALVKWQPLPTIMVHKTLINQLLLNLVGNALKYHDGKDPKIEVGYTEEEDRYIFYVKDNGIGIAPKFFEKIFVIFQRLHNKSEYSGTGIGLAICKKIVEIHHGRIWVESEPAKGSTFYFSIPKKKYYETGSKDFAD